MELMTGKMSPKIVILSMHYFADLTCHCPCRPFNSLNPKSDQHQISA